MGGSRKAQANRSFAAEVDAMSLWKSDIDHSLADLAQVGGFSAEGEAFLKPGGLMVAWEIRHDDFESLSAEEVDAICERFEGALGQLGDMDMLHVVHHRLPAPNYPQRESPTRAAALADAERRSAPNATGSQKPECT